MIVKEAVELNKLVSDGNGGGFAFIREIEM